MNPIRLTRVAAGLCLLAAVSLTGCANRRPLYDWNDYQGQVYSYFKPSSKNAEDRILEMEEGVQTAAAEGSKLPPGYMAHLGLLYLNAGRTDQAVKAWHQEKAQFPESTRYIDFLLNNMKKNGG